MGSPTINSANRSMPMMIASHVSALMACIAEYLS
jgi:hypothetical protein